MRKKSRRHNITGFKCRGMYHFLYAVVDSENNASNNIAILCKSHSISCFKKTSR